ncbi:MAG TPA: nucleotidyltransferase family protein [Reyranella sp.]|jgi:hypothetical protein|nr:nucleotidyltransferase family protein [Reyranella sp.]
MPSAPASVQNAFDFLTLLARPQVAAERAEMLLRGGLDFAEVMRLAEHHTVRPQLIDGLARLAWRGVPDELHEALDDYRHAHVARALLFTEEIRRLARLFEGEGIRYAVFKGVVLARQLYGDPAAREYSDIDVIVPAARMADAERALAALGYRAVQGEPAFRHMFLSSLRQYSLVRDDGLVAVDLHWEFSGAHVPFPLSAAEIWPKVEALSIGGQAVRTLAGGDLALLLAGHGTKERWRCLEWINDFAHLIARHPELDWSCVHARARAAGCGGSVTLGAALAERVLDLELPGDLARLVQADRRAQTRAEALLAGLRAGPPPGDAALPNFSDIGLCDRPFDKAKAVLQLAFTPTVSDHGALPLPRPLWPLYYVTRPVRLAAKAGRSHLRWRAFPPRS